MKSIRDKVMLIAYPIGFISFTIVLISSFFGTAIPIGIQIITLLLSIGLMLEEWLRIVNEKLEVINVKLVNINNKLRYALDRLRIKI